MRKNAWQPVRQICCGVVAMLLWSGFAQNPGVAQELELATREVIEISKTLSLNGRNEAPGAVLTRKAGVGIYDFEGKILRWTGRGDCSQKEGQPPMLKLGDNVTIRNAIIEEAPDGVHINGSNVTVDNVAWPIVCEDALTVAKPGCRNIRITNCYFASAEDKAIQINHGKQILIENCVFRFVSTGIRLAKKPRDVQIRGNVFLGCDVCIHLSGKDVDRVRVGGNEFRDAGVFLRVEKDAHVRLDGGNHGNATNETLQIRDGGKLIPGEPVATPSPR